MELGDWLPLAITGLVGLAGITATLGTNLANLAAQKRRDALEMAARERAHLLDERRAAYAELVALVSECIVHVDRPLTRITDFIGSSPSESASERSLEAVDLWTRLSRASAVARVLAPQGVGAKVDRVASQFRLGGSFIAQPTLFVKGSSTSAVRSSLTTLIAAMHEDLTGAADPPPQAVSIERRRFFEFRRRR